MIEDEFAELESAFKDNSPERVSAWRVLALLMHRENEQQPCPCMECAEHRYILGLEKPGA